MAVPLPQCRVCGRAFWPSHRLPAGPAACGPACAEKLRRHNDLTLVAVLAHLAKPVAWRPDGTPRAWLCLQPTGKGR